MSETSAYFLDAFGIELLIPETGLLVRMKAAAKILGEAVFLNLLDAFLISS